MDLVLLFIVQKMMYISLVSFQHRVGLVSIIFHAKHFEQKYVLTGFIHFTMETWPTQYENKL